MAHDEHWRRPRCDRWRPGLSRLTGRVLDRIHELGIVTPNRARSPIIEVPLADRFRLQAPTVG